MRTLRDTVLVISLLELYKKLYESFDFCSYMDPVVNTDEVDMLVDQLLKSIQVFMDKMFPLTIAHAHQRICLL